MGMTARGGDGNRLRQASEGMALIKKGFGQMS